MDTIPAAVRRQALHAFSTLPPVPGWKVLEGAHVFAALHALPYPQPIVPRDGLTEANIDRALNEARALVRGHGREALIWVTVPIIRGLRTRSLSAATERRQPWV